MRGKEKLRDRGKKRGGNEYMNLLYFPLTDSSERGSMPGEKERGRGGWKGKEQMIEERKEHG